MALPISDTAKLLSEQRDLEPNIILEIDGVDTIYGSITAYKVAEFDDDIFFDDAGLVFDGSIVDTGIEPLIALSGTSTTITQQVQQDKGSVTSVSSLKVELIDLNGEISNLITPGNVVDELLGRRATVYLGFKNGTHPDDSVAIHGGIIDTITPLAGSVALNIASPEQLKRQSIFIKQTTALDGAINNSVTTIMVDTTAGFISPSVDSQTSYIQIDDEIIKYTGLTDTTFTGCVRASLGTVAASHTDTTSVDSFYRLQGNAIDLALKLMISGGDEYFITDKAIKNIGGIDVTNMNANIIFFNDFDIENKYGLVAGDLLTITGSASNDVTDIEMVRFGQTSAGSYIQTTGGTFTWEPDTAGTASFKSQYNTLNEGMAMTPQDVDVARHQELQTRFSSSIPTYDFYLKDTVDGKDFLASQIYYPAGFYALPRNLRASVGITVPPIADANVVTLDETNVVKPGSLQSERSINKYYYNAIVVRYEQSASEDKYLAGKVVFSGSSVTRFPNIGNKPLTVNSDGLRNNGATQTLISVNARRWLDRYQAAAEIIPKVQILFKDSFTIEIGDTVIYGSPSLQMTDITSGDRNFTPKLYEVVNKSMNLKTGEVFLDLLSTNFALDGRYGIVSPSSLVDTGSTTTQIVIKDSFSTVSPQIERDKWDNYVGQAIQIRSSDYSYLEETVFTGFSGTDDYVMLVSPAVATPPGANYIIDIAPYPNTAVASDNSFLKLLHCFFDPEVQVATGISQTKFTVGAGDIGKFIVGSIVRVHTLDYSVDSGETTVSDITGTTITVADALGFTPSSSDYVDLIGFIDGGRPYRLI